MTFRTFDNPSRSPIAIISRFYLLLRSWRCLNTFLEKRPFYGLFKKVSTEKGGKKGRNASQDY